MAHANTKNLSNIPVILNTRLNRIKNYCPRRANTSNLTYVKCANKQRNCFVPIKFCLLNTRSINKKELILKDFTVENDIDIFAVTETWLRDDNTFSLADVCPKEYYFYHIPRKNSRGGGVGVLLKQNIRMKTQPQRQFTSFEYIDVIVNCSNSSTRMVTIYRPPPSKKNQLNNTLFLEEFSKLMEQLIIVPGNLLIVGDFNYHVDNTTNPETIKFNKILEMFNLQQHVNGPTHKKGHTLDLILTRIGDRLVTNIEIHDPMLLDHLAVSCTLQLEKPPLERVEIQYRRLRNIDMDSFNNGLRNLNLRSDAELPAIVDQYEKTLKETLEKHAPLKRRTITLRPLAPWYNEEIGKAKRQRRRLERRWRSSKLCIHREMYAKQCQIVNDMIKDAKTTYYSSAISNNKHNQKVLFNTIDKLLHRKPKKRYPTASSKTELVNNFGDFFCNKIAVLRNELTDKSINNNQPNPVPVPEPPIQCVEFTEFQTVTEQEVGNIVDKISKKSCELDPIPATILKNCKETLLSTFVNIINKSLETGCMPAQLKEAILKPKLKKNNLEFEEYSNFRPISNLKFLSKIIEKAVATQLMGHLINNNLEEPFQSAYKRCHSTETALLKVQNDILIAIDNKKCVALLLLDMSAAFDTVDHEILLERMSKRFEIKGKVLKWFRSYLQNRTQTVMIDGVKSMSKDLNWGVPQGSVLGPILYLLYTSPVGDIIRRYDLDFHFYADDSQLYLTFEPTIDEKSDALVRIETCVGEIDWWMVSNKLKLNGDKTKLLIINAHHRPCPPIDHIEVSNFKIQPSETVSNIGVTFDKHMSLDQHVTNVCKACFFHLRNIAKIRDYLSTADTEILVHALITSKLDSCNS